MTISIYAGGQWRRPWESEILNSLNANKVPRWTPEDEANLTRRVQRLAAKAAKP